MSGEVTKINQARRQYADRAFPELRREDFEPGEVGDTAYRNALINQYKAMREYQYELICSRETLDMYNVTSDLDGQGVPSNAWMWSGTSLDREVPSAGPNSLVLSGKEISGVVGGIGDASCAAAAARTNMNIGTRFGVSFRDIYESGASSIYMHDGTPFKMEGTGKEFLRKMIDEGHIAPGTMITRTREGGGHEYTVSSVIKDKKGKITHITLQANNNTSLRTYSVDEFVDVMYQQANADKKFYVTDVHLFAQDAVSAEIGNMLDSGLSCEELQQRIDGVMLEIDDNLTALETIGQTTLGYNSDYGQMLALQSDMYNGMTAALPQERPDDVLGRRSLGYSTGMAVTSSSDEILYYETENGHFIPETSGDYYFEDESGRSYMLRDGQRIPLRTLDEVVVTNKPLTSQEIEALPEENIRETLKRQEQVAYAKERVESQTGNAPDDARIDAAAARKKSKGEYVDVSTMQRGRGSCDR